MLEVASLETAMPKLPSLVNVLVSFVASTSEYLRAKRAFSLR